MYEFELNFGGNRIRAWKAGGPNGIHREWGGPSHDHADYELHVMLAGEVLVDVEGKTYTVEENQVMVIAPGRYHCRLPGDRKITRLCVNFSVTEGPWVRSLQEKIPVCRVFDAEEEILSACRSMESELSARRSLYRIMLQSDLLRILVSVFRWLDVDCVPEPAPALHSIELQTHQVDLFFETHIKDGAKIEDLAEQLFLSKSQLNRLLRENYGMTFREKMLRARMSQAARLLRHTDLPVYRVAEEVGYTVPSSFHHVFRNWYGMTPEQYRSMDRQKP